MKNKYTLTIIATFLFLSSVALGKTAFIETLYEKKDLMHIHLLQQSPLFDQQISDSQNPLKSLFLLSKYAEYITAFDQKYQSLTDAENEEQYLYLVSKFSLKKYQELSAVIVKITQSILTPKQKVNFKLIKAVDLFLNKKYVGLESLYIQVSETESFPEDVLINIEKLRDILYLQVYKPAKFIQKDEDYSVIQGWNSILTGDYELATMYYEKAKLPSTNTFFLYSKAMNEMKSGNYYQARAFFSELNDPIFDKEKQFRIIESYYYDNNAEKVLTGIQQFRFEYPGDTNYTKPLSMFEAMSHYTSGNYSVAKKQLTQIQSIKIAKFYLAEIYFNEKNYAKAQTLYQGVIAISIKDSDLYQKAVYGLAWTQFRVGKYVSAKTNFSKLISLKNKNMNILLHSLVKIGDSSYNLHKYRDALKAYHKAVNKLVSQKDNYPELYKNAIYNVARIYSKLRKYKQSNEYLDQYLKGTDNVSDIFIARTMQADNYTKMKQNKHAATILQELILTYQPENEDIYIILADGYYNMKEYQKAINAYQDYLKVFIKGNRILDANYGIIQSLFYLKDYEEALKLAKETDSMFQSQLHKELQEKIKFEKEQSK